MVAGGEKLYIVEKISIKKLATATSPNNFRK